MSHRITPRIVTSTVYLTLVVLPLTVSSAESVTPSAKVEQITFRSEMVPMRDGVRLSTDIFLPTGTGKFPVTMTRTPYSSCLSEEYPRDLARELAACGYVSIVQDCRGTARSEGDWDPYVYERNDEVDLLQWVLKQPWCNGQVGMFGGSYLGYTQLAVAIDSEHALKAMVPVVPTFDWHETTYRRAQAEPCASSFRLRDAVSSWEFRNRFGDVPQPHQVCQT